MSRVIVDPSTAVKLQGVVQPVELCDEAGNVLGHFEPDEKSPAVRAWLKTLDHGLSEDELQRRFASRDGYSTEEVVKRLRGPHS